MRNLAIGAATTLFLLAGLAIFSLAVVKPNGSITTASALQVPLGHQIPTVLPDADYVPIYPGATVQKTTDQSVARTRLILTAHDDIHKVEAFYEDALLKLGWVSVDTGGRIDMYTWTEPSGMLSWHLFLDVAMAPTLDDKETSVTLMFGRYPDLDNLPLYSGVQRVETSHTEKAGDGRFGGYPTRVTTKTYETSATPDEVAEFYTNTLPLHGWLVIDQPGVDGYTVQPSDINSEEGLHFLAAPPYRFTETIMNYQLFITASAQKDGQSLVRLRLEEGEMSIP